MKAPVRSMLRRLTLCAHVGLVLAATGTPAAAEPASGGFSLRAALGGGSVTESGFDDSPMAGIGAALTINEFVDAAGGLRYYPEFSSGGGRSKGTIEVLMLHAGAELGWRAGPVKPFVRPELELWQARPEYQGRDLDDDQGVGFGLFTGINLSLAKQFGLTLEAGRSFDVSGTHLDTVSLGAEIRF